MAELKSSLRWLALALVVPALSGCLSTDEWDVALSKTAFMLPEDGVADLAAEDIVWPDFDGHTLRILDHGAFAACADLGDVFEELTGAKVQCTSAADTGTALNRAVQGAGDPEFDILYGVDNMLMHRAMSAGIFRDYTPQLAERVGDEFLFFADEHEEHGHAWPATPVDYGYIALNIDHRNAALSDDNTTIENLFNVRKHADQFVTQDPRTSTPGLAFFLTTIKLFGEDDAYDWQDYWGELFEGGVKVTPDWSSAYETHFTGGYGAFTTGHIGDRAIVTSYTTSPPFEAFNDATDVADVLLAHGNVPAAFHQIQTMGILDGTPVRAIAEAWIEFSLTDDFQALAAPENAVYPVIDSMAAVDSVADTYDNHDNVTHHAPGSFGTVAFSHEEDGPRVEAWVAEWVALCEAHDCT